MNEKGKRKKNYINKMYKICNACYSQFCLVFALLKEHAFTKFKYFTFKIQHVIHKVFKLKYFTPSCYVHGCVADSAVVVVVFFSNTLFYPCEIMSHEKYFY